MKKNTGFTLIEMVLALIVVGIIAGFVGRLFFQEAKLFSLIVPRKEAKIEGILVMDRIMKDLRFAYRNEFTSGSNVTFKMPLDAMKGYSSVNIYQSGAQVYMKTNNGTASVIADNVSFFRITSISANYTNYTSRLNTRNLVKAEIIISKGGNDIRQESNVYLRNRR